MDSIAWLRRVVLPVGLAFGLSLAAMGPAKAVVLLDTFEPGDLATGLNWSLFNNGGNGQSVAVSFGTASAAVVTSVVASLSGTGNVTLGIMADAAGLPSGAYLHSIVLGNPTANVSLAGLNWALAAGDYWLAAIGSADFQGTWPGNSALSGPWAYTDFNGSVNGPWLLTNQDLPAARIVADESAVVPVPATLLLLGMGLAGLAIRRRVS